MKNLKIPLIIVSIISAVFCVLSIFLAVNTFTNYERTFREATDAEVTIVNSYWLGSGGPPHTYNPEYDGYKLRNTSTETAYVIEFASEGKFERIQIILKIYNAEDELIATIVSMEKYGLNPNTNSLPYQTNVLVNDLIKNEADSINETIKPFK